LTADSENVIDELLGIMLTQLEIFTKSTQLEVQERACYVLQVSKLYQEQIKKGSNLGSELHLLFSEEFKPVAPGTQKRVPIPEGLDLDSWINKPPPEVEIDKYSNNDWAGIFPEENKKSSSPPPTSSNNEPKHTKSNINRPKNAYYLLDEPPLPPLIKLTKEDLNLNDDEPIPDKKSKRKKRHDNTKENTPTQKVDIQAGFEEPIGAIPIASMKEIKTGSNDLGDISFDEPLQANEKLPELSHYDSSKKPNLTAIQPETKEDDKKKHKHRHHKDTKDKDKEKKHRRPKKDDPSSTDNQLIQLDGNTPEPSVKVTAQVDPVNSILDLDPLASLTGAVKPVSSKNSAAATTTTTVTSTAATQKQGITSESIEEKPHKHIHRHEHKHKRKSESSKETSSTQPATSTASPVASGSPVQAKSSAPVVPKLKTLIQDSNIVILYEIQLSILQSNQMVVQLQIKNLLTSGNVHNFEFNILSSLNTKLIQPNPIIPQFALQPQQVATLPLTFTINSITQLQKLKGSVTYTTQGNGQKLDFVIVLPCSAFVMPVKISIENFTDLLQGADCAFLSSTKIKKDFQSTLSLLSSLLHVALIELKNNTATFYGKTIQEHHIAVYVKDKNDSFVQIDLKSSDSTLASSLISEISTVFN